MKKRNFRHLSTVNIIIYSSVVLFYLACNAPKSEINPEQLCREFYELNKNTNFDSLCNFQILGIREYSEYDNKSNKIHRIPILIQIKDTIENVYLVFPVFKKGANEEEKKIFFSRCKTDDVEYLIRKYKLSSRDSVFDSYVKEVETMYAQYDKIKVPDILHTTNIELHGSGNYIEFVLYKSEEEKIKYSCYYVKNTVFANDRLSDYFNKLPKFDEHWYYKVN
ncbi:MAG: hypothetical protein LBV75_08805 [Paludibacter sp.]|jgi:hypothetical protein|nr:hypothetical protein [Paludibacter sp.]